MYQFMTQLLLIFLKLKSVLGYIVLACDPREKFFTYGFSGKKSGIFFIVQEKKGCLMPLSLPPAKSMHLKWLMNIQ